MLSPADYKNSWNYAPHNGFYSQMWAFIFSRRFPVPGVPAVPGVPGLSVCFLLLSTPWVSLPSFLLKTIPWTCLAPDHISTLPMLFHLASSLHLAVESPSLPVVFWFIYIDVIVIWFYPWEEVRPGSSYSTIFLRSAHKLYRILISQSYRFPVHGTLGAVYKKGGIRTMGNRNTT